MGETPTAVVPGVAGEARGHGSMAPVLHRVADRRRETADVVTLTLVPLDAPQMAFRNGQFNMLTAFGVGEVAISISSAAAGGGPLEHTVRDVGAVSHALCEAQTGDVIGVRGPFGSGWEVPAAPVAAAGDVVVVAGGIGLAPLRGAVSDLAERHCAGDRRVFVAIGAREPSQLVFDEDLERWSRAGASVAVTVDVAASGWSGRVGLVTTLVADAGFDAAGAVALVCGPEIMMRFSARALVDAGVPPESIQVSLERNMQCGGAWCGHCQLGPFLLCRDGPVLPYAGTVERLLLERER